MYLTIQGTGDVYHDYILINEYNMWVEFIWILLPIRLLLIFIIFFFFIKRKISVMYTFFFESLSFLKNKCNCIASGKVKSLRIWFWLFYNFFFISLNFLCFFLLTQDVAFLFGIWNRTARMRFWKTDTT